MRLSQAGYSAPSRLARQPRAKNPAAGRACGRITGAALEKKPPPRSPPTTPVKATARPKPISRPSAEPGTPIAKPSISTCNRRMRGGRPSTPSSANCVERCATAVSWVANTRKAPVSSATMASTLRLTR
jgi:hypothetical protein